MSVLKVNNSERLSFFNPWPDRYITHTGQFDSMIMATHTDVLFVVWTLEIFFISLQGGSEVDHVSLDLCAISWTSRFFFFSLFIYCLRHTHTLLTGCSLPDTAPSSASQRHRHMCPCVPAVYSETMGHESWTFPFGFSIMEHGIPAVPLWLAWIRTYTLNMLDA